MAIAISLLVPGPAFATDDDPIEKFEAATHFKIFEETSDEFGPGLLENGLSQYDVNQIISKFAPDVASCVTTEIVNFAENRSIDTDSLIAGTDPGTVNSDYFTPEEFLLLVAPCIYTAAENAGISPL